MFDTMQVGRRIRTARIEKNMTQMELADRMGVSYQAVSNWERGNSMPDIGKLPELCELLGVTFETLLGGRSEEAKTVEKVLEGEPVTVREAARVAPMLPPQTVRESARQAQETGEEVDIGSLVALAPFLDQGYLDSMAEQLGENDIKQVRALAPFLSVQALGKLARKALDTDFASLIAMAPFLEQADLDELAGTLADQEQPDLKQLAGLAPFLEEKTLEKLMDRLQAQGLTWKQLLPLAPFLSQGSLISLLRKTPKPGEE